MYPHPPLTLKNPCISHNDLPYPYQQENVEYNSNVKNDMMKIASRTSKEQKLDDDEFPSH